MTTIATAGRIAGSTSTIPSRATATTHSANQTGAGRATTNATTNVQLSDLAKMLTRAFSAQGTSADDLQPPDSFGQMVSQRTSALATTLTEKLTAAKIPVDAAITLHVDKYGSIHAEGAYKKKLEQFFKDNPDVAEEVKAVANLNTLKATAEALRLYNEEKKAATTNAEKDRAFDRYTQQLGKIQSLAGTLTLKDGNLTSAVMDYADSLTSPAGEAEQAGSSRLDQVA
jgi:hypothetical protein